jgi:hypothetical protein
MGRTIKTNIKTIHLQDGIYEPEVIKSLVKTNPLVILDNIPGKSYYPVFDNCFFKGKEIPLIISRSWSMGGGGISPDFISFFQDPKSSLYLPAIVINGLIWPASVILAKKIYKIFKSKIPNKRQTVIYYSEQEEVTYYEFPSETSKSEFEEGLKDISEIARKFKSQTVFIRSLKNKKWVLEDRS